MRSTIIMDCQYVGWAQNRLYEHNLPYNRTSMHLVYAFGRFWCCANVDRLPTCPTTTLSPPSMHRWRMMTIFYVYHVRLIVRMKFTIYWTNVAISMKTNARHLRRYAYFFNVKHWVTLNRWTRWFISRPVRFYWIDNCYWWSKLLLIMSHIDSGLGTIFHWANTSIHSTNTPTHVLFFILMQILAPHPHFIQKKKLNL